MSTAILERIRDLDLRLTAAHEVLLSCSRELESAEDGILEGVADFLEKQVAEIGELLRVRRALAADARAAGIPPESEPELNWSRAVTMINQKINSIKSSLAEPRRVAKPFRRAYPRSERPSQIDILVK